MCVYLVKDVRRYTCRCVLHRDRPLCRTHLHVLVENLWCPPPPPAQGDTAATKKYKGVHFGNLKSLRTQFKGKASYVCF